MLPVAFACLFASANAYGATIDLGTLVANPSFEAGNQPVQPGDTVGCPVGWTCTGSPTPGFTSYTVTSAQYTAGSDGLTGGKIVPDGTHAATSPTNVEGSGHLTQTGLGTYSSANTYVLSNLWVGTPSTLPSDNTTPTAPVGTIILYFTANGLDIGSGFAITVPTDGQWLQVPTLTLTLPGIDVGASIGLDLFVDSTPVGGGSGNNRIANFDIMPATVATPEPASIAFLGMGLLGLATLRRRRS
ncbi:MAG TPA: PEP-CTERM sorting domain-containing protein [Bryobacteraceae bacterium]